MVIFLYGPDSYRRQEKLKQILADYKTKHSGLSIDLFDVVDAADIGRLKDFSRSDSLFDAFRLGIVRGIEGIGKSEQKAFAGFLKDVAATKGLTLILLSDKKPVKEFGFLIKKPVLAQEFPALAGAELLAFIRSEATRRGVNLDQESLAHLSRAFQGDSWAFATELDKIALLGGGRVTIGRLRDHVDAFDAVNLFSMLGLMRTSRTAGERLRALEELMARHEDSAMLFNMIAVAPREGLSWKKAMADYDAAVKSGKLEYDEVLLDIVLGARF